MILALAGGVGGAKLANGLAQVLAPGEMTVAVNTGDDFRHFGLHISPDLDTVMYNLAGVNNPVTGWGLAGESWRTMDALKALGAPGWFNLGDLDIATHLERTRRLEAGESLSDVTAALCAGYGVAQRVVPMSDDPVATMVRSGAEWLAFQDYFVARQCAPEVSEIRFDGIAAARPSAGLAAALGDPGLRGIVVCPSNPFVSVAPILGVPGVGAAVAARRAPVAAVSPIVGGRAIKGPAAKMMVELGLDPSVLGVARHYRGVLDGLVIDRADAGLAAEIEALGMRVAVMDTVMHGPAEQKALAEGVLGFVDRLAGR